MSFENDDYDDDLIIDENINDDTDVVGQYDTDSDIAVVDEIPEKTVDKKLTRAEKRINELTWKAKTAEERAIAAEQAAQELARRLSAAEQDKSSQTISSLKAAKIEALESADYERVAEIDEQLVELRYGRNRQDVQPSPQPEQQSQPKQPQKTTAQSDWEARNQDVLNDPGKIERANRILKTLVEQHHIPADDPKLWGLLEKNMNRTRAPAQAGNGVGDYSGGSSTQGLTRADLDHIKELGYDYKDKKVQETYLKSKRSAGNGGR